MKQQRQTSKPVLKKEIVVQRSSGRVEKYDTNRQGKPSLNDKEPVLDIVAANMNKVLHDPSKRKGSA